MQKAIQSYRWKKYKEDTENSREWTVKVGNIKYLLSIIIIQKAIEGRR